MTASKQFSSTLFASCLASVLFAHPIQSMAQCCNGRSAPIVNGGVRPSDSPAAVKPVLKQVTIDFRGSNDAAKIQIGDCLIPLVPNTTTTFNLENYTTTDLPFGGEDIPLVLKTDDAQPGESPDTHKYSGTGKVKVKPGDGTKDTCPKPTQQEEVTAPNPDDPPILVYVPIEESSLAASKTQQTLRLGSAPQASSGGSQTSNPNPIGVGVPRISNGGTRMVNNVVTDIAPYPVLDKTLGKSEDGLGAAGYLTWDPSTGAVDPSQVSNYRIRGKVRGVTVVPASGGPLQSIQAHDGVMVLTQENATTMSIKNYAVGGSTLLRTTTVQKLSANPPTIDSYTLVNDPATNKTATGIRVMESETGGYTASLDSTLWSGTRLVGSVMHLYTEEGVVQSDGVSKRIWRTHSQRDTASSGSDRIVVTTEILQPAAGPAVTVSEYEDTYHRYSWGEELTQRRIDPNGINQVTKYVYYDVGAPAGIVAPSTPDLPSTDPGYAAQRIGKLNYGKLKLRVDPDGGWFAQYFTGFADAQYYTGFAEAANPFDNIHVELRPWKDGPAMPSLTCSVADLQALFATSSVTQTKTIGGRWNSTEERISNDLVAKRELINREPFSSTVVREDVKEYVDDLNSFLTITYTQSSGNYVGRIDSVRELKMNAGPDEDDPIMNSYTYSYFNAVFDQNKFDPDDPTNPGPYYNLTGESKDPLDVTVRTEEKLGSPTVSETTVRDRDTGLLRVRTKSISNTGVETQRYFYDAAHRIKKETVENANRAPLEFPLSRTSYPSPNVTEETDSTGVTTRTTVDAFGRVVENRILGVPALAASTPAASTPVLASPAQDDVVTVYSYEPRAGGAIGYKVVETTKAVDSNGVTLVGDDALAYSRVKTTEFDAAGRVVSTIDEFGKQLTTAYTVATGSGQVVTVRLGSAPTGTIVEENKYYRDGKHKSTSGASRIAEDYDYGRSSYKTWQITTHPGQAGEVRTARDGIGRTVEETAPSSIMVVPPATAMTSVPFTSVTTYDAYNRIASRSRPAAAASGQLFEVFSYVKPDDIPFPLGAFYTFYKLSALSTDNLYSSDDANQRAQVRYLKVGEEQDLIDFTKNYIYTKGAELNLRWVELTVTNQSLHPKIDGTAPNLVLTSPKATYTASATGKTWTNATTTVADSKVSITSTTDVTDPNAPTVTKSTQTYNGLLTHLRTTAFAPQVISYNPMRERLREVSESSIYWPWLSYESQTGALRSRSLPSSTTAVVETYSYFTGDNINAGQLKSKTSLRQPTGTTYYDYNGRGQLEYQWGGGDYPVRYTYDSEGRMTTMTTYQTGTWTGNTWPTSLGAGNVTEWKYGEPNGSAFLELVTSKVYPAVTGGISGSITYKYWLSGSIAKRTWQRGLVTDYTYDSYNRLTLINYGDATPDVTFGYENSTGRLTSRTDGAGLTVNTYSDEGLLKEATTSSGYAVGAKVTYGYDALGRLETLGQQWGTSHIGTTATYSYDPNSSRLTQINTPSRFYNVTYQSGADVPASQLYNNGAPATEANAYFKRVTQLNADGLPDSITHTGFNSTTSIYATLQFFDYDYDLDRVSKVTRENSKNWNYAYDEKGQVTGAYKKMDATAEVLAGTQSTYTYDEIGNRTASQEGGSSTYGAGLRTVTYTPNELNQYTTINRPQQYNLMGERASSSNAISIFRNGAPTPLSGPTYQTDTSGLYWRREVSHPSTDSTNVHEQIQIKEGTTIIEDAILYIPRPTVNPTYDADGNLLTDGRWTYVWDGENRLLSMTSQPQQSGPAAPAFKISYKYDGLSRRIGKKVESRAYGITTYVLLNHEGYLYDGWNMIMTVRFTDGNTAPPTVRGRVASYLWGPDIGSSPYAGRNWQAAGGVGGLVMVTDDVTTATGYGMGSGVNAAIGEPITASPTTDTYVPLSDRLGNITGYRRSGVATSTNNFNALGTTGGILEYDAFGKEIRNTGRAADIVPFHFSSKFADRETGLSYYGYRYYDPVNGRWLGRDPIEEDGGVNLNVNVNNCLLHKYDVLGLSGITIRFPIRISPPRYLNSPPKYLNSPPRYPVRPFSPGTGLVPQQPQPEPSSDWSKGRRSPYQREPFALPDEEPSNGPHVDEKRTAEDKQKMTDEHRAYKNACDDKSLEKAAEKAGDLCEKYRLKVERKYRCALMRAEWDRRWMPGRHAKDIYNAEKEYNKALEELNKLRREGKCNDPCPHDYGPQMKGNELEQILYGSGPA